MNAAVGDSDSAFSGCVAVWPCTPGSEFLLTSLYITNSNPMTLSGYRGGGGSTYTMLVGPNATPILVPLGWLVDEIGFGVAGGIGTFTLDDVSVRDEPPACESEEACVVPQPSTAVPEPSTLGLIGLGLVGLARVARRRRYS